MASIQHDFEPPDDVADDVAIIRDRLAGLRRGFPYGINVDDDVEEFENIEHDIDILLTLLDAERARTSALQQALDNCQQSYTDNKAMMKPARADNGYENPGYRGAVSTNGQEVQD